MTTHDSSDPVARAADCLLERFGPHVRALMAYGSRVCGQARIGSAYDFWVIVDDLEAFHRDNAEFYRTQLNVRSTPDKQIAANRAGPLFYALNADGLAVKYGVLGESDFAALCRDTWWTVKGRMQKPLRVIRATPAVEAAIQAARQEGLECALNFVPKEFTLDELLRELVGLSYRAEVRPERKAAKVQSILEAGRAGLETIYAPMLDAHPQVERQGETYRDLRDPDERRRARRTTLRALRRSKWSRRSLTYLWRNYRSYRTPVRYLLKKATGEVEKAIRRHTKFLARP